MRDALRFELYATLQQLSAQLIDELLQVTRVGVPESVHPHGLGEGDKTISINVSVWLLRRDVWKS